MTPIEKVINIAKNELGYLEKASNSQLYDKTANAGYGNYTKYWQDIASWAQGQPWCAAFITWIFTQAFGQDKAKQLLKHYPYISCPYISNLFALNANPKVGDIVIFYRNNVFAHTGLVIDVQGDKFTTIEGNTSSSSGIIANGGGVFQKSYYNSQLPGTKFITVNWDLVKEEEPQFTQEDFNNFLQNYFNEKSAEDPESWSQPQRDYCESLGIINGDENGYKHYHSFLTREQLATILYNMHKGGLI